MRDKEGLRLLSLFSGAGGMDLGFEAAGFETLACVEKDRSARETLRSNRPGWKLLGKGDIHDLTPRDMLEGAGVGPRELDAVIGGPPCQPFSKSAFWRSDGARRLDDPRSSTLLAMLDVVAYALPRAVVIENVRGIAYRGRREALDVLRGRFAAINREHGTRYLPVMAHLSATEFGVPQLRERAFVVAFRDGTEFVPPEPTHGPGLLPVATAWDALGGIAHTPEELAALAPSGKWAGLLPSIPEGGNYMHHTDRGAGLPMFGWRIPYWSFLLKLAKSEPSWTVQATPGPATGPFHWDDRQLSGRELAALQTFPADYALAGSPYAVRRQVGNAVPSALAEAVALRVRAALTGGPVPAVASLATPRLGGCPPPRVPGGVPDAYLACVGEHAGRDRRRPRDVPAGQAELDFGAAA